MAWTVTFSPDAGKTDVGTASATWDSGQSDQFTFSGRVDSTTMSDFATAAITAQGQNASMATNITSFQTALANLLNGA